MKHSYHAHHAAIGAGGSFLVGLNGAAGGFVRGASYEGTQDVFVGYRYAGEPWTLLPFVRETTAGAAGGAISVLPHGRYGRMFGWANDRWMAQALVFLLTTPFCTGNDAPADASQGPGAPGGPAIFGHLDYDNSHMSVPVELAFAVGGGTWEAIRGTHSGAALAGVVAGEGGCGFATRDVPAVEIVAGREMLGVAAAGLVCRIPAGGKAVFPLVLGWGGAIAETLGAGLGQFEQGRARAQRRDDELRASGLSEDARRQLSLATRERIASAATGDRPDLSLTGMRAALGL